MPEPTASWLQLLLTNVVIPEVIVAIRAHMNASSGRFPTEAEVIAALPAFTDAHIAVGKAFLERTDPTKASDS